MISIAHIYDASTGITKEVEIDEGVPIEVADHDDQSIPTIEERVSVVEETLTLIAEVIL